MGMKREIHLKAVVYNPFLLLVADTVTTMLKQPVPYSHQSPNSYSVDLLYTHSYI